MSTYNYLYYSPNIFTLLIGGTQWCLKGATSSFVYFEKKLAKLFKIVTSNPFQSSPSSAILVPFCLRITPLVVFFFSKLLFLRFPAL